MIPLEQALEAERLQLSLICSLVRLRDLLATDLLATASFTNGADPPYVQTKSTRNERRKRWFSGWRRRALKSARDHEKREAAETVQAAERKQQQAAQRRAKAAALDRKTAALKRRHREWIRKQINKRDRLLNQLMEKRAAEIRRKWRRQQHEEILQRAAERKRRRRERHNHNLTAALAQRRHWRLAFKALLLFVFFAAYLECAAAMPRRNAGGHFNARRSTRCW